MAAATGPVGKTVCQIARYNAISLPDGPDRLSFLMGRLLRQRLTFCGFTVFRGVGHLWPACAKAMGDLLAAGRTQYRKNMIDGTGQPLHAFVGLLRGESFGRRVIRVGPTVLPD